LLEDSTAVSGPCSLLLDGVTIVELDLDRSPPEGVNRVNMTFGSRLLVFLQNKTAMLSGNQQRYIWS